MRATESQFNSFLVVGKQPLQYVKAWACLCSSKISFTKSGALLDLLPLGVFIHFSHPDRSTNPRHLTVVQSSCAINVKYLKTLYCCFVCFILKYYAILNPFWKHKHDKFFKNRQISRILYTINYSFFLPTFKCSLIPINIWYMLTNL